MPRTSSRHKSHRSSQKNKGRWDVLPEPLEKRGNAGEVVGKKGIERDVDVSGFVSDRWTGNVDEVNVERLDVKVDVEAVVENIEKLKSSQFSQSKSKYGSSRKREGSEEGRQEDQEKKRAEKVLARRENSGGKDSNVKGRESGLGKSKDCGQVKERGRGDVKKDREMDWEKEEDMNRGKEYRLNKEKEPEKFADFLHRNSQTGSADGKFPLRGDAENKERHSQNGLSKAVHYKDLGKQTRRDVSAEKYKYIGSGTDNSDRNLNSDDRVRNGTYKEQRYKDEKYRENYQEDSGRDQKHRGDKRHAGHGSVRSENKYHGTDMQVPEMHDGSRVKDIDHESSWYADKHNADMKVNKRSSVENELCNKVKHNNASLLKTEVQKKNDNYKLDIGEDIRLDSLRSSRVDSTIRQNHQKNSFPSNLPVAVKDEERSQSKERHHTSSASSGDLAGVSGANGRSLTSQSVESVVKRKDIVQHDNIKVEESSHTRYYARSDGYTSTIHSTEKMTTHLDQQYSRKRSGSRGYDFEETRQKRSYSKDGREPPDDGSTRVVGSLPSTRTDHFPGSSPAHIPQHTPIRYGADISVLGSFEENNRNQAGDRKSNNQFRRNVESIMNRGQSNTWKGNWPSQSANRFVGYPHGPSPGFHPVVHSFPPPSLYSVRPFMEINHPVPFQIPDNPFAWQNPSDSCPPHFQGWHGRTDWEQSRHFVGGNRGFDVDGKFLNDQKESQKSEFLFSHNEHIQTKPTHEDGTEREQDGRQLPQNDQNQFKRNETSHRNDSDIQPCIESLSKCSAEMPNNKRRKIFESAYSSNDNDADFCRVYLSKLNVSVGLAQPELYKKFIAIAGTGDVTDQDSKPGINTAIRSYMDDKKPLFPPLFEEVFKETIGLYKKTIEGFNVKFSSSIADYNKSSVEVKTYQEESHASVEATAHKKDPIENPGKEPDLIPSVDSQKSPLEAKSDGEERDATDEGAMEVDPVHKEDPIENLGNKPDLMPSSSTTTTTILSVESPPLGCEDLKSVCLSRIHNSLKSTH